MIYGVADGAWRHRSGFFTPFRIVIAVHHVKLDGVGGGGVTIHCGVGFVRVFNSK